MWISCGKTQVCPQKQPFMWMSCAKTQVPPQKRPYMWMNARKSAVPPQKQPFMWIYTMNSGCCHRKVSGAFLFAEAPDAFLWPQPESSGNYMQKQPNMWMNGRKKASRRCERLFWWCHRESNQGHKDFQSFALPTELWHHS